MKVPNPPPKPLLVFDGDCGFCRRWVARGRRLIGDRLAFEPYQSAAARFPGMPRSWFRQAVQLIEPDGSVYSAAEAVFRALALSRSHPECRHFLTVYETVPAARPLAERTYRWVADHRSLLSRMPDLPPRRQLVTGLAVGLGLGAALAGAAVWRQRTRRSSQAAGDDGRRPVDSTTRRHHGVPPK
jgi:predicted DCC family thiol-disulfide oxidoreductase YuxK